MNKKPFSLLAIFSALSLASLTATEVKVSGLTFTGSEKWTDVSTGAPMRAAELKFDAEGDMDPIAVFYHFGAGQGGAVDANVNRWKGQFEGGPTKEEREELDGGALLIVLTGTYLDGPPFGGTKTPRAGYRMLAAIIPSEQGDVFIKLTAPETVADEAREPFVALVKSALKK